MSAEIAATEAAFDPADSFVSPSEDETARLKAGRASSPWPVEPAAAPAGPPPFSLGGDLRTMVLSDILLWVASRKKTGTLQVRRRATRKRVVFQDGVLHSASSNDPRETLGQFLVRDGLVSEEQLFKALLVQEEKGSLLGVLLVSDGLLTGEQLKRTLREKAEQIVYDLFLWGEGEFLFQEGLLPRNVPVNLEMETTAVVAEGTRRRKRWQRIRERLASGEASFRAAGTAVPPADPLERRLFELAAAGKTLAAVSLETRRSEFETAERLLGMVENGLLVVDAAAPEWQEAADAVGAIEGALRGAREALAARRYDAAFEGFQEVLALDHLNHEAKKGLIAVSDARKRQRLARRVPVTAVPTVVLGALALTRQRFTAQESFLLSRINGSWDVQSLLKLLPFAEEDALALFARLADRKVIALS